MKKKWLGHAGLAFCAAAATTWVAVRVMGAMGRRHDQEVAASYTSRLAGQVTRADGLERAIDDLQVGDETFEERREAVRRVLGQARAFLADGNLPMGHNHLDDVEEMLGQLAPQPDEGTAAEAVQE